MAKISELKVGELSDEDTSVWKTTLLCQFPLQEYLHVCDDLGVPNIFDTPSIYMYGRCGATHVYKFDRCEIQCSHKYHRCTKYNYSGTMQYQVGGQ